MALLGAPRGRFEQEPQRLLRIPKPIALVRLQTTAQTIYTAETDADFVVQNLRVANVTAGALTYSVRLVLSGGSPTAANSIAEAVSVAANTTATVVAGSDLLMQPGSFLSALCSSNDGINIVGWGYEVRGEITT